MSAKIACTIALVAGTLMAGSATAATLIANTTLGYYNDGIGTDLDGTNPFGATFMFPAADVAGGDPVLDFGPGDEPDLSTAATALGSWLTNPAAPGGSWSATTMAIPTSWAINDETAIIYEIDGGAAGIDNVSASFGVDNGVFVWLNGTFLGGHLRPGGSTLGEFMLSLGNLGAGMNYLQVLREDHGGASGYSVLVTGDVNMAPVPLPATGLLLIGGLALFAGHRRKKQG